MKQWIISHINTILISLFAVISPVMPLLLTTGFLIMADFCFGIFRAYKTGEVITSRKMGNSISKIFLYNLAILSMYLLNHYIINTELPLEKIVAGLIAITEIRSIDESFNKMFGFSFWDKVKSAIKRGTSTTKDLMEDIEKTANKKDKKEKKTDNN